jgi:hypothetical protein
MRKAAHLFHRSGLWSVFAYPDRTDKFLARFSVTALPPQAAPHSLSGIQSEADLHCHLPVRNLVIFKVTANLCYLKPIHISDRLASSLDRIVHSVFDAVWRGTDQLNLLVNVITHEGIKPLYVAPGERIPRSKDVGYSSTGPKGESLSLV